MVDLSLDKIKYGGLYHYFFWDKSYNSVATVTDCLPNCTCFVIGDCGVTGSPKPVSRVVGAGNWHNYLANDWTCIPFDKSKIKVGDIIQWVSHPHVARVFKIEGDDVYVRASYYTGEHGYSYKDGAYDTREMFNSLEEVSKFMAQNYPFRYYHEQVLEKEIQQAGGMPEHILVMPKTIEPVEKDDTVDQIRTTDDTLRVRTGPSLDSSIVGHVQIGYYNVLNIEKVSAADKKYYKESRGRDLNNWYEIAKDRWCGDDTTEFIPKKKPDSDITKAMEIITEAVNELQEENNRYKEAIKQIADIVNKLL